MKHIMIDLETLDSSTTSAIVAIGAVAFDLEKSLENDSAYDSFYLVVDPASSVKAGLTMSADTVVWWLKQSQEARQIFSIQGMELTPALVAFSDWIKKHDPVGVWGNGSDFDNAILNTAYKAVGLPLPWKYYKNRCFRTMKNCFQVEVTREGIHHNAVDDAAHQVKHLKTIVRQYNLTNIK